MAKKMNAIAINMLLHTAGFSENYSQPGGKSIPVSLGTMFMQDDSITHNLHHMPKVRSNAFSMKLCSLFAVPETNKT